MKKLIMILVVIFVNSILVGCLKNSNNSTGVDFSFITIDGKKENLSNYRGKVVILDLMGVRCLPCQYEMSELEKIFKNYSREQLAIISIDVWATVKGETVQDIEYLRDVYKKHGVYLNWTFGIDDGTLWKEYVIDGGVPSIYIFDQRGRIYFKHVGITFFSEIPPDWPHDKPKPPILKPMIDALLK